MILYTWGTQGSLSVTFPFKSRVFDSSLHPGPSFTRIFEFQSALKGGHFGKWEEEGAAIQDPSPTGRQAASYLDGDGLKSGLVDRGTRVHNEGSLTCLCVESVGNFAAPAGLS